MSNQNDKIYTPPHIVDEVLEVFLPMMGDDETVLEPFRGKGAFYDKLPANRRSWCEIDDGVDYLKHTIRYGWVITNPPYSTFAQMLPKLMNTADNVVVLIPTNKILSSMPRMMDIDRAGFGIKHIHYVGSGRQIKFPFGFPVGAVYLQRGHTGTTKITYADRCYGAKARRTV